MHRLKLLALILVVLLVAGPTLPQGAEHPVADSASPEQGPFVVVLGISQDGGYPQAGCSKPCCERAFGDPAARRNVSCLGLVDPASGQRFIIDTTPDFREQLHMLDEIAPRGSGPLDGILLTHGHIGHYAGLIHLGREVMGARQVPVWAMPRMARFLASNGPWDQLIRLENIVVREATAGTPIRLSQQLTATPLEVPHRDEYSEVVGFLIQGPRRSLLYVPDIDDWERWEQRLEALLDQVDVAYLDGTFFSLDELPGRKRSEIPHPPILETMKRLATLPSEQRAKVRFIHLNHSNPVLQPASPERATVEESGMRVAEQGEREAL